MWLYGFQIMKPNKLDAMTQPAWWSHVSNERCTFGSADVPNEQRTRDTFHVDKRSDPQLFSTKIPHTAVCDNVTEFLSHRRKPPGTRVATRVLHYVVHFSSVLVE